MIRLLYSLLIVLMLVSLRLSATGSDSEKVLVDYKLLYTYSRDSLISFWKKKHIPRLVLPVRYAVDMYEITYRGLWLDSSYVLAKGVLYVPHAQKPMAEMTYCHGTRISLQQTYGVNDLEQIVCIMHAADGYIAMFPFYYGLGGGEKEHIYHDAKTEALSTIYMIKACRELLQQKNIKTTGQLFLTGYSQGGHASLATHKIIESHYPEMHLTASSPMSGAYDLAGVQAVVMDRHYDRPHYLPYIILSYQYAYKIWPGDVWEVFKPQYRDFLQKSFSQPRKIDYDRLDDLLPKIPCDMITDEVYNRYLYDTSFPFTSKLRENTLLDWAPKAPIQLCACYGDNEVLYQNTVVAYHSLRKNSDKVYMRLFGKNLAHNPCAPFAILKTKYFFDNFRKGKKHPERFSLPKNLLLSLAISIADKQEYKKRKRTGKVETNALAVRGAR